MNESNQAVAETTPEEMRRTTDADTGGASCTARDADVADAEPSPKFSELVRDAILRRFKAVAAEEDHVHDEETTESLHDMRVASRRLRAALRVFQPYLPARAARRCAKRVRRLTRGLGASREWDVHAETLARLHAATVRPAELAAIEHVMELVDARRMQERRSLTDVLQHCDLKRLGKQLRRVTDRVRLDATDAHPRETAWETLEPMIRAAFEALPRLRERESAEELHLQRIAVKRLRYAVELLEPLFTTGAADTLARLKRIQETLGRHHDHVVLEELLVRILSRLTDHGRRTLAEGLVGAIDRLRVERREKYDEYLRVTQDITTDCILNEVRVGLNVQVECGSPSGQ